MRGSVLGGREKGMELCGDEVRDWKGMDYVFVDVLWWRVERVRVVFLSIGGFGL